MLQLLGVIVLYVTFEINGKKGSICVNTNTGKKCVIKEMDNLIGMLTEAGVVSNVISVVARDDSLDFVKDRIDNIPISRSKSSQIWFGDDAKFIVFNLI